MLNEKHDTYYDGCLIVSMLIGFVMGRLTYGLFEPIIKSFHGFGMLYIVGILGFGLSVAIKIVFNNVDIWYSKKVADFNKVKFQLLIGTYHKEQRVLELFNSSFISFICIRSFDMNGFISLFLVIVLSVGLLKFYNYALKYIERKLTNVC